MLLDINSFIGNSSREKREKIQTIFIFNIDFIYLIFIFHFKTLNNDNFKVLGIKKVSTALWF